MTGKTINLILLGALVGVLLGGLLGGVIPDLMLATAIVGKLYFNALALIAIILVLVGFPLALAKYGDLRRFDSKSASAFVITASSAVVLIAVGVVLVRLVAAQAINSAGLNAAFLSDFFRIQASVGGDYLGLLLPEALLRAVLNGTYLGWVLFALIVGLVLPEVGTRGRTFQMWLDDLTRAMLVLANLLLVLAPIGLLIVSGVLVAYADASFGDLFGTLWYPVVLSIAITIYCAVVLPLAIKWWQKVPESKGQRDDNRGRDRQFSSSRPPQRNMGQDRGSRGRDQRFDRNRDRTQDRPERADRPRGDREERGDRERGRRDFRRDSAREDSPFAVGKSAQVFDPEAPSPAVQLPEVTDEAVAVPTTDERPGGEQQRRERPDRGPRDRRDRDRRGGGGRDRQGRGGRDRGRGPRRFDRTESSDSQPAQEFAPVATDGDPDLPSDLSRVFEPAPDNDTSSAGSFDDYRAPRTQTPEETEHHGSTDDAAVSYGRGRHGHRGDQPSHDDSPAPSNHGPSGDESEPKAIDHYSTDGIEFGRASRRKMKR